MNLEQRFALGVGAHQRGELGDAERAYREMLQVAPNHAGALHYLGMILVEREEVDAGYELMRRSVELMPTGAFLANFGAVCRLMKRNGEAQEAYEAALKLDPRAPATWNNLGNLHGDLGRLEAAIEAYRQALALDPQHPNTRMNLAKSLGDAGKWVESESEFRRALEEKPDAQRHGNLLLNMHCDPGQTAETIFAEHVRWAARYAKPVGRVGMVTRGENADRKLKVGYVGGDFREHPAGHVILPLLEHHDRERFSVVLYSTGIEDELTGRFRAAADVFVDVAKLSTAELAERGRADGIDILVDCANHTSGNRLDVFGLRPAAVSFTAFGLPSTTGISAIDYRLTDSYFDPVELGLPSAEERVRMDPCAWCYDPVGEKLPEVGELPYERKGHVTFGSFNNLSKTSEAAVAMWAEVLRRVPGSTFMMVAGVLMGQSAFGYERVRKLFKDEGIGEERLILVERTERAHYFQRYGEMDVGLDTFPFCGGVTTLDALYMGVPVVSLAGRTYVSRTGVSILSNVGLGELVAQDAGEYVRKAVELAGDVGKLRELRKSLRGRLKGSVLMDGAGYARRVEGVYREKWRKLVWKG